MKRSAEEEVVDERPEKKARIISIESGEEDAAAVVVPAPVPPPLPQTEGAWWFVTYGAEVPGYFIREWTPPSAEIAEMMHKALHAPNGRLWVSNLLTWLVNGQPDDEAIPASKCAACFPGKTRDELGKLTTVVEWDEIQPTLRAGNQYTLHYSLV
jgi:hypothetical protein